MADRRTLLQVEGLCKSYPTPAEPLAVLTGIDLELRAGEALAVTGPSGSGKSTLLNLLGTLDRPTAGRLTLGGVDPAGLDDRALAAYRAHRIGFVFQSHHLLPGCTALENVLVGALAAGGVTGPVRERALALLERLGLADRADHLPAELSGGQAQRVALARALVNEPVLLLADEPTGNLDRRTGLAIGDVLAGLVEAGETVLVVATHDPELAARFGRRADLVEGKLREGDHA